MTTISLDGDKKTIKQRFSKHFPFAKLFKEAALYKDIAGKINNLLNTVNALDARGSASGIDETRRNNTEIMTIA